MCTQFGCLQSTHIHIYTHATVELYFPRDEWCVSGVCVLFCAYGCSCERISFFFIFVYTQIKVCYGLCLIITRKILFLVKKKRNKYTQVVVRGSIVIRNFILQNIYTLIVWCLVCQLCATNLRCVFKTDKSLWTLLGPHTHKKKWYLLFSFFGMVVITEPKTIPQLIYLQKFNK